MLLFAGAFAGAIVSTPILSAVALFPQFAGSPLSAGEPKSDVLQYYNTIVLLLLTLLPIILFFTYFYVKGASEDRAAQIAKSQVTATLESRISSLRYELRSNQNELAWRMSDYLVPVVREQTEQYIQDRGGFASTAETTRGMDTAGKAAIIIGWLRRQRETGNLSPDEVRKLEDVIDMHPPDTEGTDGLS